MTSGDGAVDDAGGDGRDGSEPATGPGPAPDPDRVALLRTVAEEVRGESGESEQVAAMLYRVSDLYDPDEETTPEEIYRNMRNILRVRERGTLARDADPGGGE